MHISQNIAKILNCLFLYCSGRKRRGSDTLSDSSDEGDYGFSWSSSEERSSTPVMSECTAAMVLMNLSHAQQMAMASASKEAAAAGRGQGDSMQQRMMQFMHRGSAAAQGTATSTAATPATAEDTQNSPQGKAAANILHCTLLLRVLAWQQRH